LKHRPGAYLWLGQGRADPGPDGERALHHPCYDFNDDALPLGVRWFCEVAERELAPAADPASAPALSVVMARSTC
jgi:hippurate hydrolase